MQKRDENAIGASARRARGKIKQKKCRRTKEQIMRDSVLYNLGSDANQIQRNLEYDERMRNTKRIVVEDELSRI